MQTSDAFPGRGRAHKSIALVKSRSFRAPSVNGWHDAIAAVAVTPNGHRIVSGGWDSTVRVWTLATACLEYTRTNQYPPGVDDSVTAVAVTPDGQKIVTGSCTGGVRLWDLDSGKVIGGKWNHRDEVTAVTTDGNRIISLGAEPAVAVWDPVAGHRAPLTVPMAWRGLAITPDLQRVITGGSGGYPDHSVQVWHLTSGRPQLSLEGHTDLVLAVAVAPDGRHAVTASRDTTTRVWNLTTGRLVHILHGHTGAVGAIAVTSDGHQVITGSDDATLRVWDLATGTHLATWASETEPITCCAVSPADPATLVYGTKANHIVVLTLT